MRLPGRIPAPISFRSGTPTATATSPPIIAAVSGTSTALESLETSFHQDLNGDGVIGIPAATGTVIEALGSTSLVEVGNDYYLENISSGTGPELKYGGAAVVAGQFAPGRRSAWSRRRRRLRGCLEDSGANQFSIWNTDSNGNFTSYNGFVGNQPGVGIAGDQLPPGFEWRRRDRYSRGTGAK